MLAKASVFGLAAMAACLFATGVQAGQYEFLAAPQINLSLVYRLDKLSGDVIACQFAHNPGRPDVGPGAFGVTSCYRSGDGATKQDPGDYGLIATRHEQEGGVFRVDYRTGALSICYFISSVRSRAITKRLRTSMLYAPRPGSRRPPPPRIPAARSANCRPPVRRETDAPPTVGRPARIGERNVLSADASPVTPANAGIQLIRRTAVCSSRASREAGQ